MAFEITKNCVDIPKSSKISKSLIVQQFSFGQDIEDDQYVIANNSNLVILTNK